MLVFRQLFDPPSSTYTCLLGDSPSGQALLIDPVFAGSAGHIPGARLLPLAELAARSAEIDATRPVVTVCRSGARSAQATVLMQKAGYSQLANLAGGMLRWRAEGLPFEQGGR